MFVVLIDPCIPSPHLITHLLLCSYLLYISISNIERDRRNWLRGRPREMDLNWWRPRPREIEVSWWQPREIGESLWRRREIRGSWWRRSPINPCLIGYPFSAQPTSLVFCMWDLLQDECTYPGGVSSVLPSEYKTMPFTLIQLQSR